MFRNLFSLFFLKEKKTKRKNLVIKYQGIQKIYIFYFNHSIMSLEFYALLNFISFLLYLARCLEFLRIKKRWSFDFEN